MAGSYPAFYLSSFRPVEALKGRSGRRSSFIAVTMNSGDIYGIPCVADMTKCKDPNADPEIGVVTTTCPEVLG